MNELTETELDARLELVQEVMGDVEYLIIAKKRTDRWAITRMGCSSMTPDEQLGLVKVLQIELELNVCNAIMRRKEVKEDAERKEAEENG